jgi:hypothetical protein
VTVSDTPNLAWLHEMSNVFQRWWLCPGHEQKRTWRQLGRYIITTAK